MWRRLFCRLTLALTIGEPFPFTRVISSPVSLRSASWSCAPPCWRERLGLAVAEPQSAVAAAGSEMQRPAISNAAQPKWTNLLNRKSSDATEIVLIPLPCPSIVARGRLIRNSLSERQSRNFLATKWPFGISAATTPAPGWHIGSPSAQGNPPWPTMASTGLTRSAKPK